MKNTRNERNYYVIYLKSSARALVVKILITCILILKVACIGLYGINRRKFNIATCKSSATSVKAHNFNTKGAHSLNNKKIILPETHPTIISTFVTLHPV